MSLVFVQLSDIHFGQEKGGDIIINDDVKEQLLSDAREYVSKLRNEKADGVIISGDIAYAGKKGQYETAGNWLDRLTSALGCDITDVQVVPGNHDIDRDKITAITQNIIDDIIEKGDVALDKYLEDEVDREFIYKQFDAYRKFAEGYDCPLDADGKVSRHRIFEIAPGRRIKFLGVNTALICSKSEKEQGGLILGKRQRVIPTEPGLETVVIAHHPLNWLQDSADANLYIKSRARVFISGHEHSPSHKCEEVGEESDLLMIASGAAVPPDIIDDYNYCYNILEFSWLKDSDSLSLTIHGRTWDNENKKFVSDKVNFDEGKKEYILKCPNFKKLPLSQVEETLEAKQKIYVTLESTSGEFQTISKQEMMLEEKEIHLVLLKFFRDLNNLERLNLLIELGALPSSYNSSLNHTIERSAFDKLIQDGKLKVMHEKINLILQK